MQRDLREIDAELSKQIGITNMKSSFIKGKKAVEDSKADDA